MLKQKLGTLCDIAGGVIAGLMLPILIALASVAHAQLPAAHAAACDSMFEAALKALPELPKETEPYSFDMDFSRRISQPSTNHVDQRTLATGRLEIDQAGQLHIVWTCTGKLEDICDVMRASNLDPAAIATDTAYNQEFRDWLTANPCP